jgi:hypothetical protein
MDFNELTNFSEMLPVSIGRALSALGACGQCQMLTVGGRIGG